MSDQEHDLGAVALSPPPSVAGSEVGSVKKLRASKPSAEAAEVKKLARSLLPTPVPRAKKAPAISTKLETELPSLQELLIIPTPFPDFDEVVLKLAGSPSDDVLAERENAPFQNFPFDKKLCHIRLNLELAWAKATCMAYADLYQNWFLVRVHKLEAKLRETYRTCSADVVVLQTAMTVDEQEINNPETDEARKLQIQTVNKNRPHEIHKKITEIYHAAIPYMTMCKMDTTITENLGKGLDLSNTIDKLVKLGTEKNYKNFSDAERAKWDTKARALKMQRYAITHLFKEEAAAGRIAALFPLCEVEIVFDETASRRAAPAELSPVCAVHKWAPKFAKLLAKLTGPADTTKTPFQPPFQPEDCPGNWTMDLHDFFENTESVLDKKTGSIISSSHLSASDEKFKLMQFAVGNSDSEDPGHSMFGQQTASNTKLSLLNGKKYAEIAPAALSRTAGMESAAIIVGEYSMHFPANIKTPGHFVRAAILAETRRFIIEEVMGAAAATAQANVPTLTVSGSMTATPLRATGRGRGSRGRGGRGRGATADDGEVEEDEFAVVATSATGEPEPKNFNLRNDIQWKTRYSLMLSNTSRVGTDIDIGGSPIESKLCTADGVAQIFGERFLTNPSPRQLASMLFPMISENRFINIGNSEWIDIGRSLYTIYRDPMGVSDVGLAVWEELTAQKILISMIREWFASVVAPESRVNIRSASERKLLAWAFSPEGGLPIIGQYIDLGGATPTRVTAAQINGMSDKFDFLYSSGVGSEIPENDVAYSAIAEDIWFSRTYAEFYDYFADACQTGQPSGQNFTGTTEDFLTFRSEYQNTFRAAHSAITKSIAETNFVPGRTMKEFANKILPPNFVRGAQTFRENSPGRAESMRENSPGVASTLDGNGCANDNQPRKETPYEASVSASHNLAAQRFREATNKRASEITAHIQTPEDFEWNRDQEINCALMFIDVVNGEGALTKSTREKRCLMREIVLTRYPDLQDLEFGTTFTDTLKNRTSIEKLMMILYRMGQNRFEPRVAIAHAIDMIRIDLQLSEKCAEKWSVFGSEQLRVSTRTLAGFAREDSPDSFAAWKVKWEYDALMSAAEKPALIGTWLAEHVARRLWLMYIGAPKHTAGGGIASIVWYRFAKGQHRLEEANSYFETDIEKFYKDVLDQIEVYGESREKLMSKKISFTGDRGRADDYLAAATLKSVAAQSVMLHEKFLKIGQFLLKNKRALAIAIRANGLLAVRNFSDLADEDPHFIAFNNGVIDTSGSNGIQFRPGKLEDFITKTTNISLPFGGMVKMGNTQRSKNYTDFEKLGSAIVASKKRPPPPVSKNSCSAELFSESGGESDCVFVTHSISATPTLTDLKSEYSDNHPHVRFFMKYISEVFPDAELRDWFLIRASRVFYGRNQEKTLDNWIGGGNNSKSILAKIMSKMLGNYCFSMSPDVLSVNKNTNPNAPNPQLAQGVGARLGLMSEPPEGMVVDHGRVKALTGGDEQHVRKLNENGCLRILSYMLFLLLNDPLDVSNFDDATKNRMFFIVFESRWSDNAPENYEEQVKNKHFRIDTNFEKYIPILASAMAWKLFHLYNRYAAGDIPPIPQMVIDYVANYWKTVDPYMAFQAEKVVQDPGESGVGTPEISGTELYHTFIGWFNERNPGGSSKLPSLMKFVQNMTRKNRMGPFHEEKKTKQVWKGYRLRREDENVTGVERVAENAVAESGETTKLLKKLTSVSVVKSPIPVVKSPVPVVKSPVPKKETKSDELASFKKLRAVKKEEFSGDD